MVVSIFTKLCITPNSKISPSPPKDVLLLSAEILYFSLPQHWTPLIYSGLVVANLWICLLWIFHINENIQYMAFLFLTSFTQLIHVVACISLLPWTIILAVAFSQMPFTSWRNFLSAPSLFCIFVMKNISVKCFWVFLFFFFFLLLLKWLWEVFFFYIYFIDSFLYI